MNVMRIGLAVALIVLVVITTINGGKPPKMS